ncbi:general substrate transporter, partial [Aureobasidium melanogenum]
MPFAFRRPEGEQGAVWPAIAVGAFAAFGGVLYGYDTGTISDILAMPYWLKLFATHTDATGAPAITSGQQSEIVSLLSVGTFFGALLAAPTGDLLGRKLGLMSWLVVFCVGVVLQTAATAIPLFVAGRTIAGLGVGGISALIPLYQSETAPKWIRGSIVGAYQLAITIGLLLASIVGNATKDRQDTGCYRIPIAVQFAWAIILFVGLLILPETPRFYIKKGKHAEAARSLSKLRRLSTDHPAVESELAEINANHEYELSLGKATYVDCFRGNLGKRLATGCALQALQQLTGVNFIFYYGTSFFQSSGIKQPFTISLITSCINVASTFPGLYLVEKWGRRKLLLFGAIGMAVCQIIVASVGFAPESNQSAQKALVAFVCIYIFFFASTWGPCAWVVTGEIFPLKVRAKSLSMTTASNWLLNWAIAYATPYMVKAIHTNVFWVWGGFCCVCIGFVYFCIYETKGLSLEQVDELYGKVSKAWQSPGFVPTVSFQEVQDVTGGSDGVARNQSLTEIENNAMRKKSVTHHESVMGEKISVQENITKFIPAYLISKAKQTAHDHLSFIATTPTCVGIFDGADDIPSLFTFASRLQTILAAYLLATMTSAATSNIDFGERTKLAVTLFNAERFVECERELTTLLGYPELPRYYRIKCHIVRAECQENWHDAENFRQQRTYDGTAASSGLPRQQAQARTGS